MVCHAAGGRRTPAVRVLGGSLNCVRSAAKGPGRMMSCSEALCAGMGTASLVTGSTMVTARAQLPARENTALR